MEVVVKEHGVSLGYSRWALVVRRRGGAAERIPIHQVDRLWILTGGVSISSRLVRALARSFVDVVFFDGRGNPAARLFPPEANGTVAHRRAQYEAYLNGRGLELAKLVVYGKIVNQAAALRRAGLWRRELYQELAGAASRVAEAAAAVPRCGDPQCVLGHEGRAAAEYWAALSKAFGTPTRDPNASDPFNLALNYGYGILRYAVWRQAVIHGLDPYAGYLHVDKSGRPSLVLDLMEEFRPHIDLMVLKAKPSADWLEGGVLKREARAALVEKWLEMRLEPTIARQVGLAVAHLEGRGVYTPHKL
ncbi:CRISPR-associated endonuclease Cas1 [Pyrobaculum neutrophilum]|uniref:CRISPR-associated endonuclease Cas1 n=1 Tax=Pyrobaculum neutrophilum (strain DSM 2338 / JCM 9278 / NBRC 100436 / V24Sta) TaxID=444157 RepID=B1YCK7_PYRNV|nr:CRISPR-associated endonuclease Cas1 [Pyrobaculum neutrophilum]ACB39520.1 CRISPR-associated protein Cas1 [Pyrobaculum neutrophilum V24Sta]